MKKIVALFGQPKDADQIQARLREDGHQVIDYQSKCIEYAVRHADVVVLDNPAEEWDEIGPQLQLLCSRTELMFFCDSEPLRRQARRLGAYYVSDNRRTPEQVRELVGRARLSTLVSPHAGARQVLTGESEPISALRRAVRRLAEAPSTDVLLKGEPGSGKRTLAQALHVETRLAGPLLEPSDFKTFERLIAQDQPGTLYLRDLTSWSSSAHTKLARTLQGRGKRNSLLRIVAAVGTDVGAALRNRDLRPSLLYGFPVTLEVPALRQRREDLPLLAACLLAQAARDHGLPCPRLKPAALQALKKRDWPENVRELKQVLLRALLVKGGSPIDVGDVTSEAERSAWSFRLPVDGVDFQKLERDALKQALRLASGNRTRAAALLGLTRDQVRYRLAKIDETESENTSSKVA